MHTDTNIIGQRAVLVEMNISVWGATRIDRGETDKVNSNAGAVVGAAQVRKDILAGSTLRKEIADYSAGCRMWHNRQTIPWSDKGMRLLPTSAFLEYKQMADVHKAHFDNLVQTFLNAYPVLMNDAQANLGTMFDPSVYPTPEEVAEKFDFRLVFSPVPDTGDFRVDAGAEALQEMQESYASAFDIRMKAVTKEPWDRLHEMLVAMSEKMTEDDAPRTRVRKGVEHTIKRPYHESFITNAQAMCKMLGHLNITKDPELERARLALEDAIFGVDIEVVRESPEVRADIKEKVDSILQKNESYW
jgi:hypothetical protein